MSVPQPHGNYVGNSTADDSVMLVTSVQRALAFMQAASEGIIFYTQDLILDCNEAFALLVGRSHSDLVGQQVLSLFAPNDHEGALRHIYLGRGMPINAKLPLPGGGYVDVEVTGRTSTFKGQPCWVATVRDTSTVVYVTESLVRSQARYRTLVENADQVILFVQDHKVAYANPAATRFFKLKAADILDTESVFLIHPEDRTLALTRRKQMIAGDADHSVMLRTLSPPSEHVLPTSRVSWVRFYGSLVEWESRAATLIFMTDLTAQHEAQEQMRSALTREKDLGDLKTRFVSMASHEFRTPLATIQTSSELLEHYSDRLSATEKTEAIADIQRSVQRMQAMMENFLAFGRLSSGAMNCNPVPLPVLQTVRSMVYDALVADSHQHAIEVYAQAPMEDATVLQLDEMLLRQMLDNLLSNACKYSAFGERIDVLIDRVPCLQPVVGPHAAPWQLRIVVADRGMGIPPSDVPFLFASFHRAANAVNVPGTGLGLAIVDRAVQAHGGQVGVHSVEGEGAQFELLLPWVQ
jgi:PAS domain S-box-containing protein